MRSDKFGSQLERKSKNWLFTFLCFLNQTRQNSDLTTYTSKIQVFCRPELTKGGPHKKEFWQFLNTKMNITDSQSSKSR